MKNIIGLTGPSGAGKSSLKSVAENFGAAFIDCDKVVHKIFETDSDCIKAVATAFGEDTVENGKINRKVLGAKAFSTKENTELLNETVFPFVTYHILKEIETAKENTMVLDAPTLFESGIDEICSLTIAVLANRESRKDRILKRDNIDETAAELRLSAGQCDEFYLNKATKTIYNNNDVDTLKKEFENFLREFEGGK